MMTSGGPRYDLARFGMEVFRASPRQADLMIVAGRVSQKMAPVLRQIYDQMPNPKWVLAMGVCASSGGMFNNYAIVQGVDHVVPVDMYLPGCPPRPEMLIDAILKLHDDIQHSKLGAAPRSPRSRATSRPPSTRQPDVRHDGPAAMSDDEDRPAGATGRSADRRTREAGRRAVPGGQARRRALDRRQVAQATTTSSSATTPVRCRSRTSTSSTSAGACSASSGTGDTSGYGGLVRPVAIPGATERPVRRLVRRRCRPARTQAARADGAGDAVTKIVVHRGEITFHVAREHLVAVMQTPARRRRAALRVLQRRQRRALPARDGPLSCTRSTTCCR